MSVMVNQTSVVIMSVVIMMCVAVGTTQNVRDRRLLGKPSSVEWPGMNSDLDGETMVVDTRTGTVRGKTRDWKPEAGGHIQKLNWFLGIPYAEPPVKDLRFKAPEPVKVWQGVKNATRYGAVCPQMKEFGVLPTKEDCLTLNIFSPYEAGEKNKNYPVLVFIHGGSYRVGTGATYMGHPLAQRGVVVVTINYRLGVLGFLSGRNEHMSGNYGLLDQIEALKWIHDNIAAFRGDPMRVTLYGHSAGAASVGILYVSPLAEGLFQRAVLQSGSPLAFWATHNDSVDLDQQVRQLAEGYNCSKTFFGSIVRCLRKVSEEHFNELPISSDMELRPVVDGHVIPRPIPELLANGTIHVKEVILGMVETEWSSFMVSLIKSLREETSSQFDTRFSDGFDRSSFERAVTHIVARFGWDKSIADTVIHQYTNWTHKLDPLENRKMYIKMIDDLCIVAPAVDLANKLTARNIPVYEYVFNHRSAGDTNPGWRASNIDINYVFGGPFLLFNVVEGQAKTYSEESKDNEMSSYMMSLWTAFAEFGEPDYTSKRKADWTEFTVTRHDYLNLDLKNITMGQDYNPHGVAFWNKVIPGIQDSLYVETKPWYHPTILVWVLVAVGASLILTVLVLGILVCVRSRRTNKPFDD